VYKQYGHQTNRTVDVLYSRVPGQTRRFIRGSKMCECHWVFFILRFSLNTGLVTNIAVCRF